MSWFDEQLRARREQGQREFERTLNRLSCVVMGKNEAQDALTEDWERAFDAFSFIYRYYGVTPPQNARDCEGMSEMLDAGLRAGGVMRRNVKLSGAWYKDAVGAMLGVTKDGRPVALLPGGAGGYRYFDEARCAWVRVNKKTALNLGIDAICFYRPLPQKSLRMRDLLFYIARSLDAGDMVKLSVITLISTLVGFVLPYVNRLLFSSVVPGGDVGALAPLTLMMLGVTASATLISISKNLMNEQIQVKAGVAVEAACMGRILALPTSFFKDYAAGEMASRAQSMRSLSEMLLKSVLGLGLSGFFSIMYLGQIASFAPVLVMPAIIVISATAAFTVLSSLAQMNVRRRAAKSKAKLDGLVYQLITGIQKIKLSGAERRAFSKWGEAYLQAAKCDYAPPLFVRIAPVISLAVSALGTVMLYFVAASADVNPADYIAFNVSYGMVGGAIMSLAAISTTLANIKPVLEMAEPILKTPPETGEGKNAVTRLSGTVELSHVDFRYSPNAPYVLKNMSVKIRAGQYVAIVGKTGCGKSTLLRILLGLETPEKGAVYYDGRDIITLDLKTLRRKIGVVTQNGQLFQGDLFSNIIVTAPNATSEDAWEAAEIAGIAKDIRAMPMGMHTLLSEGGGGISGGQRQRILIARAVVGKPRILLLDEATSALDNVTQRTVSHALGKLKCTRIVVAHRLSTIRDCDRILMLDEGHVVEDGTYDELIAKGGAFARLVERQLLNRTG